jgi:hypothetical protein
MEGIETLWSQISGSAQSPLETKKGLALAPYTHPWLVLITLEDCHGCNLMRPVWHQWVDAVGESDSQRRFFVIQVRKDQSNFPLEVQPHVAYFPTVLAVNDASALSYWGDVKQRPTGNKAPLVAVRYPYGAPRTVELLERWYQLIIISTVELNPPSVLSQAPPPLLKDGPTNSVPEGEGEVKPNLVEHRSSMGARVRTNSSPGQHIGRYRNPPRRVRVSLPIK